MPELHCPRYSPARKVLNNILFICFQVCSLPFSPFGFFRCVGCFVFMAVTFSGYLTGKAITRTSSDELERSQVERTGAGLGQTRSRWNEILTKSSMCSNSVASI